MALLQALSRVSHHPTARELYRQVRRSLPSVSHATIYRNVQTLAAAGVLATLERAGEAIRYDANPQEHHHFICKRCSKVVDIYLTHADYSIDHHRSELSRARIEGCEIQLHGTCADCL
ncbi:MAG: transcriptional repressor [Acidobacteria bacterium]|nr:transcriptional repressor [Acidobacteriota bacterium]